MSDLLKIKRGSFEQLRSYTPAEGEPMWATDYKRMYIGDGSTAGGRVVSQYVESPITIYATPTGGTASLGTSWETALDLPNAIARAKQYNAYQIGDLTVQVGTGSYVLSSALPFWDACNVVNIVGSPSNPSLTTITTTYSQSFGGVFYVVHGGILYVNGFTIGTTAPNDVNNQQRALVSWGNSVLVASNINFIGNWANHVVSVENSMTSISGNSTVSGNVKDVMYYADGRSFIQISPYTTSFVGSPTLYGTSMAVGQSTIAVDGVRQFVGTATIQYKMIVFGQSSVRLNGTVFPGLSTDTTNNVVSTI